MRLLSLKYPNNYKIKPGERIEQELIILNDGLSAWPKDTYLIFSGSNNLLNVTEEVFLGEVSTQGCSEINLTI